MTCSNNSFIKKQRSKFEKLCGLFGLSYLIDDLEIQILTEYVEQTERELKENNNNDQNG